VLTQTRPKPFSGAIVSLFAAGEGELVAKSAGGAVATV
jgi:hypothetical protein